LQFKSQDTWKSLGIQGDETFSLLGLEKELTVHHPVLLQIERPGGKKETVELIARLDTAIDIEYYLHGGILPYVLRQILDKS
jgi:aconitate hydratase